MTGPGALERLTISWRQSPWNCKVVLDHRYDDGLWTIAHVESERHDGGHRGWQPHSAGAGINTEDNRPWLWFYEQTYYQEKRWWKCPWRIVDVLETHIKKIRQLREWARIREVERAPPKAYYEQEAGELVREVEDRCIPCDTDMPMENGKPKFRALCWMCDDRWFNDRKQLVDHIEGSGRGGKAHMKYRRRWVAAGQMERDDWLEFFKKEDEKEKEKTDHTMNVALQSDFGAVETCYMPGPPQMFYACHFPILQ